MRIELKGDDLERIFTLSNDTLDNNNFVDVILENKEEHTAIEIKVPIDELSSAVTTFLTLRNYKRQ